MRKSLILFLAQFAVLFAFTPPGLCACWLHPDSANVHPHLADMDEDHSHEYLEQMSSGVTSMAGVQLIVPLAVFLLSGGLLSIWFLLGSRLITEVSWSGQPPSPPPKFKSIPVFIS